MRLDNRPKTVCVSFTEGSYDDHEEALRSWVLFNSPESSSTISRNPERPDAALVAFEQRYLGEGFMAAAAAPDFPLAGKIELSWHKSPEVSSNTDVKMEDGTDDTADVKMEVGLGTAGANGDGQQEHSNTEARYDVDDRDDDDRWS
jgi:hypothetical protein